MGDFNTDLLAQQSYRSRKLLQLIDSASLCVLPLQATHHNIEEADTWLDLMVTSNPLLVRSHGQLPAPGFSHHDLLFLTYNLKPPKPRPKVLYTRCFSRINVTDLYNDASTLNWDSMITASSMDTKVRIFSDAVLSLFDAHAPVRMVKVKRAPAPWMSREVRMAMRVRDKAFRRHRRDRSDNNWCRYKVARNRCNQMIRNAKRRHILDNINLSSPADIWKFLGTLGIGKQRSDYPQLTVSLDDINLHFTSSITLDHLTKCRARDYLAALARPNVVTSFKFSPVAPGEVKKIVLSIKSNSVGCDGISRRMITLILDYLVTPITHLANFSLISGQFPSLWRNALIIPLPKIPNPTAPNHYRPISILPFLSKVVEACALKQLSQHVFQNNLLSPMQSGFRPGHSTTSALLKVTGDIRSAMEETKITVLVLVDFSNAFGTVSHDILLYILSHHMVSPDALEWFSTYLQGRRQSVRSKDSSSAWCDLMSGVPQGGIISPLLFSIFINFLTSHLQCTYHLYADDLQLYTTSSIQDVAVAISMINRDLDTLKTWCTNFGLSVNPTKCQAIIVGSQRLINRLDTDNLPPIVFDGSYIPLSSVVKDLGLFIDGTLNWQAQVTNVSKRVTGSLRALYRLRNFLPTKTKTTIVQTLIFPIIDYGDVCYFDLNADLLNKYDRLLNNCIRFIFNLRKYDHVSSYRSELKWLPIRQRRDLRALTTLFSFLHSPNLPSYLSSYCQLLCSTHDKQLRSSHNLLLLCPSHTTQFVHSSFFIQSVLLWNALPLEIRMATNRDTFKLKVRTLLFDKMAEFSQQ